MRQTAIVLLTLALSASARASDPSVQSGLDYIRTSGETGAAMSDYIAKDPVPIGYGDLPDGVAGLYTSEKKYSSDGKVEDRSRITLDEDMKKASPRQVGGVLFHEYSHRLEDVGGGNLSHRAEDLDGAMETLREKTRPGSGERLQALDDVRQGFAWQDEGDRAEGRAPVCMKSRNQFALRGFESFTTSPQHASPHQTRRVFSGGVPRQSVVSGGAQTPAARAAVASSAPQPSRASVRSVGVFRASPTRQLTGGSRMRR